MNNIFIFIFIFIFYFYFYFYFFIFYFSFSFYFLFLFFILFLDIELPQIIEQEKKPEDQDTKQVSFKFKFDGKSYDIVFDKEIDRLATFIPEFLEDNKLEGKCDEELIKKALQEEFKRVREKKMKVTKFYFLFNLFFIFNNFIF